MDIVTFEQQLNSCWRQRDYPAVIELFNSFEKQLTSFDATISQDSFAFLSVISFKWFCMYCTGQEDEMQNEIKLVIETNQDNDNLLASMCNAVNHDFTFLLELYNKFLNRPSRVIAAAYCRYADQKGEMEEKMQAMQRFDELEQVLDKSQWPALEQQISLRDIEQDKYLFSNGSMQNIEFQSLPNNNEYLKINFVNGGDSASLSLPMQHNDSICQSGYLKLTIAGTQRTLNIDRQQVTEYLVHTPFGLCCTVEGIEIVIANLFYHRDK